jgi:hypothetical protein
MSQHLLSAHVLAIAEVVMQVNKFFTIMRRQFEKHNVCGVYTINRFFIKYQVPLD